MSPTFAVDMQNVIVLLPSSRLLGVYKITITISRLRGTVKSMFAVPLNSGRHKIPMSPDIPLTVSVHCHI
jgi:hypothetical protein